MSYQPPPSGTPESENIVSSSRTPLPAPQHPDRVEAITREEAFKRARKNPSVKKGLEAKKATEEVELQQKIYKWQTFFKYFFLMLFIDLIVGAGLHDKPIFQQVYIPIMIVLFILTVVLPVLYKEYAFVLADNERLGVFSWGIWDGIKGPGKANLTPLKQSIAGRVSLQERTPDVPINRGVTQTRDGKGLLPVKMNTRTGWAIGPDDEQIKNACLVPTDLDVQMIKESEVAVTEWLKLHKLMDITKPDTQTPDDVSNGIIRSFAAGSMRAILQEKVKGWGVVLTKDPEASDIVLPTSLTIDFEKMETAPALRRIREILSRSSKKEMKNVTKALKDLFPKADDYAIMRTMNEVLIANRLASSGGRIDVLSLNDFIQSSIKSGEIARPV